MCMCIHICIHIYIYIYIYIYILGDGRQERVGGYGRGRGEEGKMIRKTKKGWREKEGLQKAGRQVYVYVCSCLEFSGSIEKQRD
jgi:hypothetical protein